jgi:hypothetical protein
MTDQVQRMDRSIRRHLCRPQFCARGKMRAVVSAIGLFALLPGLEGCVHKAVIPEERCPHATAAPKTRYELGQHFDSSERIDRVVACQQGKPDGPTIPSALASPGDSVRAAPVAYNAVAYKECSPANRLECWRSLEIQSWPECRRNATSYPRDQRDVALDGEEPYEALDYPSLPAMAFESGSRIELYDGSTTVVVFAADRTRAQLAVLALLGTYPSLSQVPPDARTSAYDPEFACKGRASAALAPALGFSRRSGAEAPLQTAFTHNETTKGVCARSFVDPINTLWYGRSASAPRVGRELNARGGWWMDDDAPLIAQIADHQDAQAPSGDCSVESDQRSSSCSVCDRDHIRLFSITWHGEHLVLGDAHHDTGVYFVKGCEKWGLPLAHVSSSYITPREEIARFWPASASLVYWGNTRRMPQCDGSTPHSDGYVLEEPASVPSLSPALKHVTRSLESALQASGVAVRAPPPRCVHESAAASLSRKGCDLDAALSTLHTAAQGGDQTAVCQLMVPTAVAESPRNPERALRQYAAVCAGRLYAPQLQRIEAATAGQRAQDVHLAGRIAHATLSAPGGARSASATFIYLAGRWRLLLRSD